MSTPRPEKRPPADVIPGLGSRTWVDVEQAPSSVLLVPLGSCEQHGPHLPLDTDTRIAVAVAEAAAVGPDAVVGPALSYGSSGEHQSFAGTLSIGTDALRAVLVELGRSAFPEPGTREPWRRLVFVNGHGGNHQALTEAVELLVGEGRPVSAWWPTVRGGDGHAGRTETSLLLALAPEVVGPERPVGATGPVAELLPALRTGGVAAVSPDGVLGDATGATANEGHAQLRVLVEDLEAHLARP
jgi:mycofactocin precursor peptide peptidase